MTKNIKSLAIISTLTLILLACTDTDRTTHTLEVEGFTNIRINGYDFNACAHEDSTCTGFSATSPSGQPVSGSVGCGRFEGCSKGCTVRSD